ncbi:MAG: L,D-transpeptidase [Bacteriovorax sp.]|nr:L,D-transpeptidase [Bacteriovorax sp.]
MLLPSRKKKLALILSLAITVINTNAFAAKTNFFDTLDPRSPNIEKILHQVDMDYESVTGKSAHLKVGPLEDIMQGCFRNSCKIWADVDINAQRLYLYMDGVLTYTWKTSTGRLGFETPYMDTHPDGRIYDKHTSPKYPEGDYNGLGNMPFAVFIDGGYAIHGTTRGSWSQLGTPASHGCIRVHPDNGQMFNEFVRRNGVRNVWVTVN